VKVRQKDPPSAAQAAVDRARYARDRESSIKDVLARLERLAAIFTKPTCAMILLMVFANLIASSALAARTLRSVSSAA
jgi:hypothetical protein